MATEPLRYFSFSRCDSDEMCRYKRYLSREWGGTGIMPVLSGWDLVYGNIIHGHLDLLAKVGKIDFAAARQQTYEEAVKCHDLIAARDWAALAEGTLRGFVKKIWPLWMAEYDVYDSERWIEYLAKPGFLFKARQDLLLKSKHDGHFSYREYKTTGSNSPEWIASWAKSVQVHTSLYVLREAQGIEPRDCVVQGLYKGYKDKKKSLQKSVFNYGYTNREYSFSPQYSYEYTRAKGWEVFGTYDEFPDLTEWVGNMPHDKLIEQYPSTAPIFPRDDIATTWFRQQLIREQEVADAMQELGMSTNLDDVTKILDTHFRQNFSKCEPAYGFKCEFRDYCWLPWVQADPLGSGHFKRYVTDLDVPEGSTE